MTDADVQDQPLSGRVAVVTGAGRGLGRAHALALAAAGAAVLVNDLGSAADEVDEVVTAIADAGGRAAADATDIASFAGGAAVVARALDEFGRLDVVVNNAGISDAVPLEQLEEAALQRHLAVHLFGTVGVTKAALAVMREAGRGGAIVNTTSGAGLANQAPGLTGYASAKAAVNSFTKVAALEAAPHGVTVNAVAPLAYTRMSAAYLGGEAAATHDPALVSRVVVWLASDAAADVTGVTLRVTPDEIGVWEVGHVSVPAPPPQAPPARVEAAVRGALARRTQV